MFLQKKKATLLLALLVSGCGPLDYSMSGYDDASCQDSELSDEWKLETKRLIECFLHKRADKHASAKRTAQEEEERQQRRAQEERELQQAIRNSKQTYAQEQRRAQEERELQQAIRNSRQTYAQEQQRRAAPQATAPAGTAPSTAWEPNSGDMHYAARHTMDLQQELGRAPNPAEIKRRLVEKMPQLTSDQIDKIMGEMFP